MKLVFVACGVLAACVSSPAFAQREPEPNCNPCLSAIRTEVAQTSQQVAQTSQQLAQVQQSAAQLQQSVAQVNQAVTQITTGQVAIATKKSAVVIEFGDNVSPPPSANTTANALARASAASVAYCQSINYASGKVLAFQVYTGPGPIIVAPAPRVIRLVCFD